MVDLNSPRLTSWSSELLPQRSVVLHGQEPWHDAATDGWDGWLEVGRLDRIERSKATKMGDFRRSPFLKFQ